MTLELKNGVGVKTFEAGTVFIDHKEYSIEDVLNIAYYVLTNTDLVPDDPRLGFIKVVKDMAVVPGYSTEVFPNKEVAVKGQKRLDYKDGWSLRPPVWKEVE